MEFDNQIFFNNISTLLQKKELKTGKFETDCGVKPGYMARMSKDASAKPGVDFIMKASELLGVNIDLLLKVDLSALNPTESYLRVFLDKLIADTNTRKLDWEVEHEDVLNSFEPYNYVECEGYHPLFSMEKISVPPEDDKHINHTDVIFKSKTYGVNTIMAGDSYNLRLKNGVKLYVMSFQNASEKAAQTGNSQSYEVWMYDPKVGGSQFLMGSKSDSPLASVISNLYSAISEYYRCPKIATSLEYVIDAFLNDDISDDVENVSQFASSYALDEDIPF